MTVNINCFFKLADSIISPVLFCNCEVWGAILQTRNTSRNISFSKLKDMLFSMKLAGQKHMLKIYKRLLGVNLIT